MKKSSFFIVFVLFASLYSAHLFGKPSHKPTVSFSFDDGSVRDFPGHKLKDWNQRLLNSLKKHDARATLFVKGAGLDNQKGKAILTSWDTAGHQIANHTYSHPYFHSDKVSLEQFKAELLQNERLISGYGNFTRLFRFPYLKEGNTLEKRDGFRQFMAEKGYRNGHVTIDASDWYIDGRLVKRLKEDPNADLAGYKKFYIEHLFERAQYYGSLARSLTGRQINHTLLLHHNLSAALFLDDLIQHFKNQGWAIVGNDVAYKDDIYSQSPSGLPAGESLIWALAKESGQYEAQLRYPAEDGQYEKDKMDKLGL